MVAALGLLVGTRLLITLYSLYSVFTTKICLPNVLSSERRNGVKVVMRTVYQPTEQNCDTPWSRTFGK